MQLLLDVGRYDRIAKEAESSGRSVAAVIREAIDLRFPDDDAAVRMDAAQALLDLTEVPAGPSGEGPSDLKAAYARELDRKVGAL